MDIRDIIESKRNSLNELKQTGSRSYDYIDFETNDTIIENAIYRFDNKNLEIFSEYYRNEIVFEEMISNANSIHEYEIVEEAVLDSLQDLKNKIVDTIRSLWNRFKDWIGNIIDGIKSLFSGGSSSSTATVSPHDGGATSSGETGSSDKSTGGQKFIRGDRQTASRATSKPISAASIKKSTIEKLNENYPKKKGTLVYTGYVYKYEPNKFLLMMERCADISRIVSNPGVTKDDYLNHVKNIIGGDPTDREGYVKSIVIDTIRDSEAKAHKLGELPLDVLIKYGLGDDEIIKRAGNLRTYYQRLYSECESTVKNAETPQTARTIGTICSQATKFGTFCIGKFMTEYRAATMKCRAIIRKVNA